jgi:hypothetical protein
MKTISTARAKDSPRKVRSDLSVDIYRIAGLLAKDTLPPESPELLRVLGLIRARDFKNLASLVTFPDQALQGQDPETLIALRQVRSLFSKNSYFADDALCTKAAQESFLRSEVKCRITNKRLDWYWSRRERLSPDLVRYLLRAEQEIAQLLGPISGVAADLLSPRMTSGATEDRSRRRSYPYLKLTGRLRAPRSSVFYLGNYLQAIGVDLSSCKFTAVENNTVVFVPKSWKTHRTIAKEPTHSLPFQLSLDRFIKKRLRKWGVDLSSQEKNQELARLGSLDGSLATLDLESASDTLAFNAVSWMLPAEWFKLFKAFRSSSYSAPFGRGTYAKFSSMGNGYTFTLETLIFTALCRAVGSRRYSVYGDDIVIETELVPRLIELLSFLGFVVNKEKSFVSPDSRFRESCGCDYYEGRLITPFYCREVPLLADKPGIAHLTNGLLAKTLPGSLWNFFRGLVGTEQVRLVPFNEDTRSGVFISPWTSWRTGKLRMSRPSRDVSKPWYSVPEFRGYVIRQALKDEGTKGFGSSLLWHMRASGGLDQSGITPKRTSQLLLSLNDGGDGLDLEENCPSRLAVRSRYVHGTKRYEPVHYGTPDYLFLWDEVVQGSGARES